MLVLKNGHASELSGANCHAKTQPFKTVAEKMIIQ